MSVYEYTEPPTITVNGVRLPVERVTFGALRSADPHVEAVVATRAAFAEMPHRVEFTVADDGGLFDRIARMVAEANREMAHAILPAPGASGRWYAQGSRGCFHDGCDATTGAEDGGAMWCRFAEETRR